MLIFSKYLYIFKLLKGKEYDKNVNNIGENLKRSNTTPVLLNSVTNLISCFKRLLKPNTKSVDWKYSFTIFLSLTPRVWTGSIASPFLTSA
jgi:hypothetical protein